MERLPAKYAKGDILLILSPADIPPGSADTFEPMEYAVGCLGMVEAVFTYYNYEADYYLMDIEGEPLEIISERYLMPSQESC